MNITYLNYLFGSAAKIKQKEKMNKEGGKRLEKMREKRKRSRSSIGERRQWCLGMYKW